MKQGLVLLVLLLAGTAYGQITPLEMVGTWVITVETPRGTKTQDIEISLEDGNLQAKGPEGSATWILNGDELSWAETRSTPFGKMTMESAGQLQADGSFSGTMSPNSGMMSGRQIPWTLRRKD